MGFNPILNVYHSVNFTRGEGLHPFGYNPILHVYHNEGGGVVAFCMGKMTAHMTNCHASAVLLKLISYQNPAHVIPEP